MFGSNSKEKSQRNSRPTWRIASYAVFVLGVAGAAGVLAIRRAPAAPPVAPPIVTVAQPLTRNVELWDEYVGRFAASKAVDVRPRVSGQIVQIYFQDGQTVASGQKLFTIDPRSYRAALLEAQAQLRSAESGLVLARSDYERASRLEGDDAVAASELDGLRARLQAAKASVDAARARRDTRALDLEFTEVRAPIAGRISDRRIDVGNLVAAGDSSSATLLTTIYALDPIYFSFDASEALFLKAKRRQARGQANIEIRLQDETDFHWKGELDFTDNAVDARSGTIRGRATIANPDQLLTPGMFGNMRMTSGKTVSLLVPDAAIQSDQADKVLFVLDPHDVVTARKVLLGPTIEGLRVIMAGLSPQDRVIIGGLQMTSPGSKVIPQKGMIAALRDVPPPPPSLPAAQASFASN